MQLVVIGLGNPGRRYERTRHNIGFMVSDQLAADHGNPKWHEACHSLVTSIMLADQQVLLAKPQTFMNESGRAVRALLQKYKVTPSALLVVSDDMELPFARLRLRPRGSHGGHNGLRSIMATLGTQDFPRLRIGVGRPPAQQDPIEYLLAPFSPLEVSDLPYICQSAADLVLYLLQHGLTLAMNFCNGRGDVREPHSVSSSPSRRSNTPHDSLILRTLPVEESHG